MNNPTDTVRPDAPASITDPTATIAPAPMPPPDAIGPSAPRPDGHPPRRGLLLLCPHRLVETVWQVKPEELVAEHIKGLILDLDNTLVRWQEEDMTEEVRTWLTALQSAGFKICLLSNSVLGKRSERLAQQLNCFFVRQGQKPRRGGFRKAMELMGTTPETTAIVGDQMFTDILGGNRAGIYTIMAKPIHPREFPYTRWVSRPPERLLLRWFRAHGDIK